MHLSHDMSNSKPSIVKKDVPRKRVTVSIDEALLAWADQVVEKGFRYKDRSHVFEYALSLLKEKEEKE